MVKNSPRRDRPLFLIIITFLVISVVTVVYRTIARHNLAAIAGFDACVKAGYPTLYTYPGQCATPDGRVFVQVLSPAERLKLLPPPPFPTTNWKIYLNPKYGFSVQYPASFLVTEEGENQSQALLDEGKEISGTNPPSFQTLRFTDNTNSLFPFRTEFSLIVFHKPRFVLSEQYPMAGECGTQFGEVLEQNTLTTIGNRKILYRRQKLLPGSNGVQTENFDYCFLSGVGNLVTLRATASPQYVTPMESFFTQVLSTLQTEP